MPFICPTWGRPLGTREWGFLRRYPLSHAKCAVSFLPSLTSPTSCDFSTFFSPTCCVSTKSAPRLCYYDCRLVGRSRMTAAVASSICFPRPYSRIFAASSPGGMSGVRSDRREIPSPSTPSLSNTSASPDAGTASLPFPGFPLRKCRRWGGCPYFFRAAPAKQPAGGGAPLV